MEITESFTKKGFINAIKYSIKYFGFWKSLALYMIMNVEKNNFVNNGRNPEEIIFRKSFLRRINTIYSNILCAHSPFQFVAMAEYILNLNIDGPIVQCGCFKGGSTAQLSIIAKHVKKDLYVFDSFQGLPAPTLSNEDRPSFFSKSDQYIFKKGEYAGSLEEVTGNVEKYGEPSVCKFIPGFFEDTLKHYSLSPSVVFIDVDLVSSARDCFFCLWPQLKKNGLFFTHEASLDDYIMGIMDREWWNKELNECPPLIYGAGVGISPLAASLALIKKS